MRLLVLTCVLCQPAIAGAQTPLALGDYEVQALGDAQMAKRVLPGLTQKRAALETYLNEVPAKKRGDLLFRLARAAWDEARFKAAAQATAPNYRPPVRWFQELVNGFADNPRIPSARYYLARIALEAALRAADTKAGAEAVRALQPMVRRGATHPQRTESHLWIAEFFYSQGKWAKAQQQLTAASGGENLEPWARYRLAWIMARKGNLDGAAKAMAALAPKLRNDPPLARRAPVDAAWFRAQRAQQKP